MYQYDNLQAEKQKIAAKRAHIPQIRDNITSNNTTSRTPEGFRRIRGMHGSFSSEWAGGRQLYNSLAVPPNYNSNGL